MAPQKETPPEGAAWIELPDKAVFRISGDCYFGRIAGNEIVVPDSRTSRRHAVVQRQGSRFVLVDLGSTNGTRLNDRRIFKPAPLQDGDVIGVGGLRYVFHAPAGAADHATSQPLPTTAAVGITDCWVLVAAVAQPADAPALAWAEDLGREAREGGAKLRRLRGAAILAHWRLASIPASIVREFIEGIAGRRVPAGAHVSLHHGQVRVGPGAGPSEETLLGPDVTFAHNLEATARELRVPILLSEAAVRTLGLTAAMPLGPTAVRGTPGVHALFSLGKSGQG
jgi:adenylate cyclase